MKQQGSLANQKIPLTEHQHQHSQSIYQFQDEMLQFQDERQQTKQQHSKLISFKQDQYEKLQKRKYYLDVAKKYLRQAHNQNPHFHLFQNRFKRQQRMPKSKPKLIKQDFQQDWAQFFKQREQRSIEKTVNFKGYHKPVTPAFIGLAKRYFQFFIGQGQNQRRGKTSLVHFAKQTGYSKTMVYNLYNQWLSNPSCLRPKMEDKAECDKKRLTFIEKELEENPFQTLAELQAKLNLDASNRCKGSEEVGRTVVARLLKMVRASKMKLRLISTKRNNQQDIQRRYAYAKQLTGIISSKKKFYFLDEMAINQYACRNKCWGITSKGVDNVMKPYKKQSLLLLSLLDSQNRFRYELILGSKGQLQYCSSLQKLLGNIHSQQSQFLVIHEAIGLYKSAILEVANRKGYSVIELPAFSPLLNPLQSWFCQIKQILKKSKVSSLEEMTDICDEMIENLKKRERPNYFLQSIEHLKRCIKKQHL